VIALNIARSSRKACGSYEMWQGALHLRCRISCMPTLEAWAVASSKSIKAAVCVLVRHCRARGVIPQARLSSVWV